MNGDTHHSGRMDPIAPGDFSELVSVEDPAVAPGGDRVAFVRRHPVDGDSYEATVYVRSLEADSARRMTVPEGVDGQPRWGPSGDRLAFVSDRFGGDDRRQVWLLSLDGGEADRLTDCCGGVTDIAWSPTGDEIAFTQPVDLEDVESGRDLEVPEGFEPSNPDPRVVDRTIYRADQRYLDRRRDQLYLVDVTEGTVERASEWDGSDHRSPTWGDGNTLYYLHRLGEDPDDSLEHELVALDREAGTAEPIATFEGLVEGLDATADGDLVVRVAPAPRPTLSQFEAIRVDASTGDRDVLTADLDRSVQQPLRFGPEGERIYYLTPDKGGVVVRRTSLADGAHAALTAADGHVSAFDVGGDTVAYVKSEWDHPGDLFVRSMDGGDPVRLTAVNAALLESRAVAEPVECWFEAPDGHEIQGWLLTPPPEADGAGPPHPLVLEVHGGPHAMWTMAGTTWHEFQSLAGAGYAVLWTNPRGSVGYGAAHAAAIADDWGDVTHGDLMAAVEHAAERDEIDADQPFLTGGSFGGYQTAWSIGRTDRFVAAVAQRGVYDLATFYGTTDAFRLIESEFDATPWTDQAGLYDRSPTSLVTEVDTPTLLLHSEADYRTPIATAEMYFRALRKLGVPTRLVRYPDEGHELSRSGGPAHRVDRIERIVRWFDGYAEDRDVAPALERRPNAGLSIAESTESDDDARG